MLKKALFFLFFTVAALYVRWEVQRSYFDLSQVPAEKKSVRLLVLHRNGIGEKESSVRLKGAAERLGWECYICSAKPSALQKAILFDPLQKAIGHIRPDLTINFQSAEKHAPGVNFVSLSSGIQTYTKENFNWKPYALFDGFLPTFQEMDFLKEKIESLGKPFHGMRWYFTSPNLPFAPLPLEKKLFYCGSNWDRTRKAASYQKLFSYLDQRDDVAVFGPPKAWKHLSRSYRGFLPFDGESIHRAMQQCGIVLILHSETHLKGNAPTARIFEAAAASAIIISDLHPFIKEEFGNGVFYIDQEGSPEEMYRQIERHLEWIKEHPKEAQEMARKCHEIFEEKFTLEKQLLQLHALYEQIPHHP